MNPEEIKALAETLATKKLPWKDTRWGSLKLKTKNYLVYLTPTERLELYRNKWYLDDTLLAKLDMPAGTWAAVRALLYGTKTHLNNFVQELEEL